MTTEEAPQGRLTAELRRSRLLAGIADRDSGEAHSGLWSFAANAGQRIREQHQALANAAQSHVVALRPWLVATTTEIQEDLGRLESSASAVRTCQTCTVPGLMQTADFARHVIGDQGYPGTAEKSAAARVTRQALLADPARNFEFIVTDFGLRWSAAGTPRAIMAAQLDRICELALLPNVSVGVIRSGMQTKAGLIESFHLYENVQTDRLGEPFDVVMLETLTSVIVITEPADVRSYQAHLAWLGILPTLAPTRFAGYATGNGDPPGEPHCSGTLRSIHRGHRPRDRHWLPRRPIRQPQRSRHRSRRTNRTTTRRPQRS